MSAVISQTYQNKRGFKMTESLVQEQCIPCRVGGNQAQDCEIETLIKPLPQWKVESHNGIRQLVREYKFKNFRLALAFTNKVGEIAEQEKHHPGILTEWGKVTVTWWTHSVGGLHKNDFIMAAKTDALFDAQK